MEIAYVLSQNSGGLPHYAAQLANVVGKHADSTVLKPTETPPTTSSPRTCGCSTRSNR